MACKELPEGEEAGEGSSREASSEGVTI